MAEYVGPIELHPTYSKLVCAIGYSISLLLHLS